MPKPQSEAYITPRCWNELTKKMPIPCVDTIVHRNDRVLLGYRTIQPYRNVWALIGGRMHYGESFTDTSIRIVPWSLSLPSSDLDGSFLHNLKFSHPLQLLSRQPRLKDSIQLLQRI